MTTPPRSKIYTRKGDLGKTRLVDGSCVEKFNPRVEAYGCVDELNSHLGFCHSLMSESPHQNKFLDVLTLISDIQNQLFNVGSLLACSDLHLLRTLPTLTKTDMKSIERAIDFYDQELPELKNFILPQGASLASAMHVVRTMCRRAERRAGEVESNTPEHLMTLAYLNRLSDLFFVLSRYLNFRLQQGEIFWKKQ